MELVMVAVIEQMDGDVGSNTPPLGLWLSLGFASLGFGLWAVHRSGSAVGASEGGKWWRRREGRVYRGGISLPVFFCPR